MLAQLRPAIVAVLLLAVITGLLYPLVITGIAQVVFPYQANGSLLKRGGQVIGSELIGQNFADPKYFHPRLSAAGQAGYDASASGGSNLGPTNQALINRVITATNELKAENSNAPVPVDLVTTSASGLDPDITPAAAEFQAPRIAQVRGLSEDAILALIRQNTQGPQFGFLGELRVNVLRLNTALDALK